MPPQLPHLGSGSDRPYIGVSSKDTIPLTTPGTDPMKPPTDGRPSWPWLLLPVRIVFTIIVLLSEIVRPIYRPLVNWIAALPFIEHFSDFIAGLPRGVILVLFAVPFAIAEPLKFIAIILMTRGAFLPGLLIIIVAYLMSFVLVERIYHAGREKLLTYAWLKWIMDRIEPIRVALAESKKAVLASLRSWIGMAR